MMTIDKAFDLILQQEGIATTLIKDDKGGLTRFGIASASHPGLDIANLTKEQAKGIYEEEYWNPCKCSSLIPELQYAHFSCAVNDGTVSAIKILQRACQVTADGILGPITMVAATKITLADYAAEWQKHYDNIIAFQKNELIQRCGQAVYEEMLTKGETQEKFRVGWSNRIKTIITWWNEGISS